MENDNTEKPLEDKPLYEQVDAPANEINKPKDNANIGKSSVDVKKYLRTNIASLVLNMLIPNWPKSLFGKIKMFFTGLPSEAQVSSSPFIFTVSSDAVPVIDTTGIFADKKNVVTLFGAENVLRLDNFGNDKSIHFNYLLTNYYGGGEAGYRALVQRSSSHGFRIGKIRVESKNEQQLLMPFTVADCDPEGRARYYPALNVGDTLSDQQKLHGAVEYTKLDYVVYGGTSISYPLLPGAEVTFYFYTLKDTYPVYSLLIRLKKALRIIFIKDLFKN